MKGDLRIFIYSIPIQMTGTDRKNDTMRPNLLTMQTADRGGQGEKKLLSIEDGSDDPLNGISTYILRQILYQGTTMMESSVRTTLLFRSSSKRALGEETFQREIILGMIDGRVPESLLWNIERIVTNIFIPILNSPAPGRSEDLQNKVKNELLPCLRSFTSSLR